MPILSQQRCGKQPDSDVTHSASSLRGLQKISCACPVYLAQADTDRNGCRSKKPWFWHWLLCPGILKLAQSSHLLQRAALVRAAMQTACWRHASNPGARMRAGATAGVDDSRTGGRRFAAALQAQCRKHGLGPGSIPPEQSFLKGGALSRHFLWGAENCSQLLCNRSARCQAREYSINPYQKEADQPVELTYSTSHADVSGQSWLRWRQVALVLAALLLLVWQRPPSTFAAAVAGGVDPGAAGAAFNFGAFGLRGSLTDRTPG